MSLSSFVRSYVYSVKHKLKLHTTEVHLMLVYSFICYKNYVLFDRIHKETNDNNNRWKCLTFINKEMLALSCFLCLMSAGGVLDCVDS